MSAVDLTAGTRPRLSGGYKKYSVEGSAWLSLIYLETKHFIIRQWELADAEELYQIMSDSRVHAYTSHGPWSMDHTIKYIRFILDKDFKTLELFHAACVLRDSGAIIGLTGLNPYLPKQPEIEWKFGVPFWGKGYATEIGKAVIHSAFESTDISLIYGIVNPQNKASLRVMEKIGMTCLGLKEFRGDQDMFFHINRSSCCGN
jgi:[ribosomal protein S5]-alanine N-acetyltransferase